MGSRHVVRATLALLAVAVAVFADARTASLLRNSLLLSGAVVLLSLPPGIVAAWLLVRTQSRWRGVAASVLGALVALPLYVQAAAWDAGFGKMGWYSLAQGQLASPWLTGLLAAVWIHTLAAVPWVAAIVAVGLRQVEPELEESGLLDAGPWRVAWHVTRPRIAGHLLAAALWVALLTFGDMTVTDLYQVRTFSEELYTGFALGDESGGTLRLLGPPLLLGVAILASAYTVVQRLGTPPVRTALRPRAAFRWGRGGRAVTAVALAALVVVLGVPLVNLIYKAGFRAELRGALRVRTWSAGDCLSRLAGSPWRFREEIGATLAIGALAATTALLIAVPLAWRARRRPRWDFAVLSLATLALAVPGPLVGLSLVELWTWLSDGSEFAAWLYDRTIVPPAMATAFRALPIVLLVCRLAFRTLPDDGLDAARLDGAGPVRRFILIAWPQRRAALGLGWIAAFLIASGDLAASILVTPPGVMTVAIRVFGLIHAGVQQEEAGLCLASIAVYAVLGATVGRFAFGRDSRPT